MPPSHTGPYAYGYMLIDHLNGDVPYSHIDKIFWLSASYLRSPSTKFTGQGRHAETSETRRESKALAFQTIKSISAAYNCMIKIRKQKVL